jgi:hypothetical protein
MGVDMVQTRLKVKTRTSAEAIVGAVTGSLRSPQRLILALPTTAADCRSRVAPRRSAPRIAAPSARSCASRSGRIRGRGCCRRGGPARWAAHARYR